MTCGRLESPCKPSYAMVGCISRFKERQLVGVLLVGMEIRSTKYKFNEIHCNPEDDKESDKNHGKVVAGKCVAGSLLEMMR